ncbi:MAG: Asp-tRNA(Asn)/Glu-tRNA(Gln) amidotransferase subunit GatC [Nanoarchaeota archaeon]|nr:Asp-tRNA(Asn)/Glu-tRNA(Gln) amidotransferase subunit GatC [Nanoarchaeota archaeon]
MDRTLVKQVAVLARLTLIEDEEKLFAKELEKVLDAFKTLATAPVKTLPQTVHPVAVKNRTRSDTIEPSLTQKEALANAKNKKDGYFVGPRVA